MEKVNRPLLIPFPACALVMSLAYMFGKPSRTVSPAYDAAKSIAPISAWGLLFFFGFLALSLAILSGQRHLISISLFIGGCVYTWWAALFLTSAFSSPDSSLTAWAVHGVVAYAHYVAAWRARVPWSSP